MQDRLTWIDILTLLYALSFSIGSDHLICGKKLKAEPKSIYLQQLINI